MTLVEEHRALKLEIELLKQQVSMLMQRAGITCDEAEDIELNAIIDYCTKSGNYKPLQEYQATKNAQRGGNGQRSSAA